MYLPTQVTRKISISSFRNLINTFVYASTVVLIGSMITCCKHKTSITHETCNPETPIINRDSSASLSPLVAERKSRIRQVLSSGTPVLPLATPDSIQLEVQQISLQGMIRNMFTDQSTGEPTLSEFFSIRKHSGKPPGIASENLYRVELYNYAQNTTLISLVDLEQRRIVQETPFRSMQPDLNESLSKLATSIAIYSDAVHESLGYKPGEEEAMMSATKTALNRTKCERSMHLCAAPTFQKGDKALWAIVDLTEMRLVGVRWTQTGLAGPAAPITEKTIRHERVMACNCRTLSHLKKKDWEMDYMLTGSDGLEISNVTYKGITIMQSAKLVDFHVVYSNTDGFGYSDAVGCPEFSAAAVTAMDEARVSELNGTTGAGFTLEQTFRSELWPQPCNYSYIQRFEFYDDGRFRIAVGSLGRGCGNDGTYRPVIRMVFAGQQQNFAAWDKSGVWKKWEKESWVLQKETDELYQGRYSFQLQSADHSFFIEQGRGQFQDNRGDFAYTYVTRHHSDEGDGDMPTIGPCCNINHEQGPEKFINGENIVGTPLVLWYVPQLKNDGRTGNEYCWAESYLDEGIYKTRAFPCLSGPLFVPLTLQKSP